jgi:hypothetical protein
MSPKRPNGPIEDHVFPAEIEARVITPGSDPHLHGFSVEGDIALHYRFPELIQLALTGNPPNDAEGRAFDIALQFLAPLPIAEAPTHAAVLARLCAARTSSIIAVTCIALAERARHIVQQHADLLRWLDTAEGALPARYCAQEGDDAASVDRLRAALASAGVTVPHLKEIPNRWGALFMTLRFAGLRSAEQFETVLVIASLAPALAEASAHTPTAFARYPMNLPAFVYEEDP